MILWWLKTLVSGPGTTEVKLVIWSRSFSRALDSCYLMLVYYSNIIRRDHGFLKFFRQICLVQLRSEVFWFGGRHAEIHAKASQSTLLGLLSFLYPKKIFAPQPDFIVLMWLTHALLCNIDVIQAAADQETGVGYSVAPQRVPYVRPVLHSRDGEVGSPCEESVRKYRWSWIVDFCASGKEYLITRGVDCYFFQFCWPVLRNKEKGRGRLRWSVRSSQC